VLEDLGSVNGIQSGVSERATRVVLASGVVVRLGRTTLRFRDETDAVPPAIPLHGARLAPVPGALAAPRPAAGRRLAMAFAALLIIGWIEWLGTTTRSGIDEALKVGLGIGAVTALWAGIWAIVARVLIHEARFLTHFTIAVLFALLAELLGLADEWIQFLLPGAGAWDVINTGLALAMLAASIAWHLANASYLSRQRRWRAGAAASVALIALFGLFALAEEDRFTDVPTFSGRIQVAPPSLIPKLDTGELRAAHEKLRAEVDALVDTTP
jgi:hypothetical protein